MKSLLLFIGMFTFTFVFATEGEQLFKTTCAACHTIGQGRLVGPDLKNISEKRTQDWLISFIKSSTSMVNSGDADAKAIYDEYNKLLMPDNDYTDAQVVEVLTYIKNSGVGAADVADVPVIDILANVTQEDIAAGAHLFEGSQHFINKGPACSSCHQVLDERIFSSGTLAKDLSETYDVMGSAGIAAIIRNSPFPVMKQAYANHDLTEQELIQVTAYLKSVSEERIYQRSMDFNALFMVAGIFVFFVIFMSTVILYFKRKKLPVNYDILKRPSKVIN